MNNNNNESIQPATRNSQLDEQQPDQVAPAVSAIHQEANQELIDVIENQASQPEDNRRGSYRKVIIYPLYWHEVSKKQ